jgi:hypothetical protein
MSSEPSLTVYLPNSMFQNMELKCIPKERVVHKSQ